MGKGRRPSGQELVEQAIVAAAETSSLGDLGERVLPHLQQAVGASATLLYRYDEEGRLASIAGPLTEVMPAYAVHYLRSDPVQEFPRKLAPEPRVVLATQRVDRRTLRRSPAYGEFYSAFDMEHLACAWLTRLPYGAPGMTGLLFARSRRCEAFGSEDARLLGGALPALSAAVARADRMSDLDLRRQALEAIIGAGGPARMVLAPGGRVVWASPACERLLEAAPPAMLLTLRAAGHRLLEAALGRTGAPASSALPIVSGEGRLEAHASLLRAASGSPLVLVEIERPDDAERAGETLARRFQLTPAEGRVLRELADGGQGNGAIAARLHVSLETVRTHVSRILGKLGVSTRAEAAVLAARVVR